MDSKETPSQPSHQTPQGFIDYRNPSAGALLIPTSTSQSIHQGLPLGSLTQQPMDQRTVGTGNGTSSSLPMQFGFEENQNPQQQTPTKRKPGRPRKIIPDGEGEGKANSDDPPAKRARGIPPLSGEKQLDTLETAEITVGLGITPHIIEVEIGEDIGLKVKEFIDQEPRSVYILAATGAVSSATLSETATYEGRFEIITLSGVFVNRSGSLKVTFVGLDGQILGGVVIGSLIAATQVKVVVGSFVSETKKEIRGENSSGESNEAANRWDYRSGSQGQSSDSSEQNESVSSRVQRADNNNNNNNGSSLAKYRNSYGVLFGYRI